jgi:hypothetical protein
MATAAARTVAAEAIPAVALKAALGVAAKAGPMPEAALKPVVGPKRAVGQKLVAVLKLVAMLAQMLARPTLVPMRAMLAMPMQATRQMMLAGLGTCLA